MQSLLDKVWRVLSWFGLLSVMLLVVFTFYEVFMRYVLNRPTQWTMEVSLGIMVLFGFLCAGIGLREDMHVRMTLIIDIISEKKRLILFTINSILGALMCALMFYYSWLMAMSSFRMDELTGIVGYPVFILKFAVVIGFFLLGFQFIADAMRYYHLYRTDGS
jgi:TRAP-type C4-dicarboxylate transport system permease small subunit